MAHYTSDDLNEWQYQGPFLPLDKDPTPESPEVFEWNGWWYLVYSQGGGCSTRSRAARWGRGTGLGVALSRGLFAEADLSRKQKGVGARFIAPFFQRDPPASPSRAGNVHLLTTPAPIGYTHSTDAPEETAIAWVQDLCR